jgi:hypothetical protein
MPVNIRSDGVLFFNGCNVNINGWRINNGVFSLTRPFWVTTLKNCPNNSDQQIQNLFGSTTQALITPQSATLYGRNGQQIMTLVSA